MLLLNQIPKKRQIYLVELYRAANIGSFEITLETLNSLKPRVLEFCLETLRPKLSRRKIQVLQNILSKIQYPEILDGELLIPKERRLL